MNRLKVQVIFIYIRSGQQLSRIFPSLQKRTILSHKIISPHKTAYTPFQFQGEDIILNVQVPIADYCPVLKWYLTIICIVNVYTFNYMKKNNVKQIKTGVNKIFGTSTNYW